MVEEPTNGHDPAGADLSVAYGDQAGLRALEATFKGLQDSILLARSQFLRQAGITFEGVRDTYKVLGYNRQLTSKEYYDRYARGGVAGRIVDAFPDACWRGSMELIEDEELEKYTSFEQAWADLDQKHQIQAKLLRVDKLARLSTYSVLLIGADGALDDELPKVKNSPDSLLYLTPFLGGGGPGGSSNDRLLAVGDSDCSVASYETDSRSPRFGMPLTYQLKRVDMVAPMLSRPVHWSRVIHVAEGLLRDEVYGLPALERVWNLLDDLDKITGGGAEAFWLRANQGMHVDIDKDMSLSDAANTVASLKEQADNYAHQLTRWLRTRGTTVTPLGSDVANFGPSAEAVLTQIAGAKGMPKRILTGSEMGELASSQDRDNWKDQINGRQTSYVGPYIVRPLADRLIAYGYLPAPAKGPDKYEVRWPHIQTLTEEEKYAGAQAWAQTVVGSDPVFTDAEIRDKWYGMAPLSDKQRKEIADRKAETLKLQQEAMAAAAPAADDDEQKPGRFPRAASVNDDELIRILADAIECGNQDVVNEIIGLEPSGLEPMVLGALPGHEFYGNQYVRVQGLDEKGKPVTTGNPRFYSPREARKIASDTAKRIGKKIAVVNKLGEIVSVHHPGGRIKDLAEYKFGSTQVQLPAVIAEQIFAFGNTIPSDDLYEPEGGRETDAHVTVKYGLIDPDPEALAQVVVKHGPLTPLLSKMGPIALTLGEVGCFTTDEYDVVFVEVISQDLVDLNRAISASVNVAPSDHGEYKPHATIAYVKPGLGERYVGDVALAGLTCEVDRIVVTDVDGKRIEVSLDGGGIRGLEGHVVERLSVPVQQQPHITVNMPEVKQEPPTIIVNVPHAAQAQSKRLEYDDNGRVVRIISEPVTSESEPTNLGTAVDKNDSTEATD